MNPILGTFQNFRTILCVCPCCREIYHLSDLHLKYKGKAPKTWLDDYESKLRTLEKKEEKFGEKENELREKAVERGRKKVDKLLKESLEGGLAEYKYDPYDIKAILHPVDFIVFDGLNDKNEVDEIAFLCKSLRKTDLGGVQKNVEDAIEKKSYDWKIARVGVGGEIKYE